MLTVASFTSMVHSKARIRSITITGITLYMCLHTNTVNDAHQRSTISGHVVPVNEQQLEAFSCWHHCLPTEITQKQLLHANHLATCY